MSIAREKPADNADSCAEHKHAESREQEGMRSDRVDRITDPSKDRRNDGAGLGHKGAHSHDSGSLSKNTFFLNKVFE